MMLQSVRSLLDLPKRWQVPLSPASCGVSLFLLPLALLWRGALSLPLYHVDSALFASMARDLSNSPLRTWIYMGGDWEWLFYEKPPLILWVEAATMRLIGTGPEAAFVSTLLAAHLTVLLVYKIGKRLVDRDFGFLAALILCLTPSFVNQSRNPIIEPMLMFFMALSLYWGMSLRRSWLHIFGAGAALACAFLAKGPPALAVLPVMGVYYLTASPDSGSRREWRGRLAQVPWGRLGLVLFIALGILALVDLWHFSLTSSSFWKRLITQQIVPGVLTGREHPKSGLYFLRGLAHRYWPWLPVLAAGVMVPWVLRREFPEKNALIRAWAFALTQAGVILLGFSLVQKKAPFYTYPYHVGLTLFTAIPLYVLLRKRREIYGSLVSGSILLSVGIFILASVAPQAFLHYPRPKLGAMIQMGEELQKRGIRIQTLQVVHKCRPNPKWGFPTHARFYMRVEEVTCETEPVGIQFLDMRKDRSYERDGSTVLAISHPYVLVDRGTGRGGAEQVGK
ncbi:MAG: ArnT family glycosyltransferase [Nitrospinota bacterium]